MMAIPPARPPGQAVSVVIYPCSRPNLSYSFRNVLDVIRPRASGNTRGWGWIAKAWRVMRQSRTESGFKTEVVVATFGSHEVNADRMTGAARRARGTVILLCCSRVGSRPIDEVKSLSTRKDSIPCRIGTSSENLCPGQGLFGTLRLK